MRRYPYSFADSFTAYSLQKEELPEFPKNLLDWIFSVRPTIDGKPYSFVPYPFWKKIYQDESKRIMIMAGRQVFKSTWLANILAFNATTNLGSSSLYVTYDEVSLSGFSNQKFRRQTINENPILRMMCSGSTKGIPGQRGEISFKNGSVVYLVTDEAAYSHVEGKSANEILIDEAQYQELENLSIAKEALTTTQGNLKIAGVGGEGGGPLQDEWLQTTQSEWVFDDCDNYHGYSGQSWRKKLEFGPKGLIFGDYLSDVMKGEFVAKEPRNYLYPGYHLPQTIFPHIPLTERDAIDLYKLPPEFSIEYKRKFHPRTIFVAHVLGGFYKAARRPIAREMVLACMEPYRRLFLFTPEQVRDLKQSFPEKIQVLMGIDWGSGRSGASQTVVSILLKWRGIINGRYSADRDRYYLAWIEKREPENTIIQAQYMKELFEEYGCDFGVADLGYGETQVDAIINGGTNPETGEHFVGLGYDKFVGAWTRTKITQTERDVPFKYDEEGNEEKTHILLDKSHIIQNFVDFISWKVPNPNHTDDKLSRPKLIIPYAQEWAVDFLIKDFTSITRRDLDSDLTSNAEDSRQQAQKQFNHPPDSVMSIIYALVADQQFSYRASSEFKGSWYHTEKRQSGSELFRGTRKRF